MDTERKIYLRVIGDPEFAIRRDGLSLVFGWHRETEAKNVVYIRAFAVGIHWPPIVHVRCFGDVGEKLRKRG